MPNLDPAHTLDNSIVNHDSKSQATTIEPPLVDMVCSARNSLNEAISALSIETAEDNRSSALFETCLCSIENIGMSAEIVGLDAIHLLCNMVGDELTKSTGLAGLTRQDGQIFSQWMDDIIAYVQQPSNDALAKALTMVLPENQRDDLCVLLISSMALMNEIESLSSDTALQCKENETNQLANNETSQLDTSTHGVNDSDQILELAESSNPSDQNFHDDNEDDDVTDSLLNMLSEEIIELSEEIISLSSIITSIDTNKEQLETAVSQYLSLIDRLAETSDALGLIGLHKVCIFMHKNINLTLSKESTARASLQDIFHAWPDQILTYLNKPTDDETCLSLINYLQSNQWPETLSDIAARELLSDLTKEMLTDDILGEQQDRVSTANPEDVSLDISNDISQPLLEAFFQESPQLAVSFSEHIEKIAINVDVIENIKVAQRVAHTLKGSANLVGVQGIANLTHHMEDILEFLSTHNNELPKQLLMTLQEAADCIETMIDTLMGNSNAPADAQRILQDVIDWANHADNGNLLNPLAKSPSVISANEALPKETNDQPNNPEALQPAREDVVQVPTRFIDEMFRMIGEMSIATSQIQEYLKRLMNQGIDLQNQDTAVQQRCFELEDVIDVRGFTTFQHNTKNIDAKQTEFDPLEMDQYGELHGSVHTFIEAVSDSREMMQHIQLQFTNLDDMFLQQQRLNKELQQAIITARMVPVSTIAARLQRCVRQACRSTGKQAELVIEGSDLLLDGDVLKQLTDPIMHMLRNAVDHGIEPANERITLGKPAIGEIKLKFSQAGKNIIMHCTDDGGGLNYQRIHQSAIKKGLVKAQEAMEPQQLARLILTAGFSTRDTATQISGRGVGMDIVNTTIQKLGGMMTIADNDPSGCLITLHVPISLVTSHAIIVQTGEELSAIPTNNLVQIVAPGEGSYDRFGEKMTFQLNNTIYPVTSLASLIGSQSPESLTIDSNKIVLLARTEHKTIAITVDQALSSGDLIIKSLGRYASTVNSVSGVSILGDGRVVPVLDMQGLLRSATLGVIAKPTSITPENHVNVPNILIVDDSLSARKSLSQLVEDAGFQTIIARDGVEALNMMRHQKPDIVLTDMEMPRMTGLELTANIRANETLKQVPVIMITSRTTQKHRKQAEYAGVNKYITKPFSEDELLEKINTFL